ncbi:MAG: helix-turn-helix domain-containing protein [Haloferacaceae archaeon]
MGTVTRVTIPAADFVLDRTMRAFPDVRFEVEGVVETRRPGGSPLVWVRAGSDAVEDALAADDTVADFEWVTAIEGTALYEFAWTETCAPVEHAVERCEGTVLSAAAVDRRWQFSLYFPARERAADLFEFCTEATHDIDIRDLYDTARMGMAHYGLTEPQYEALALAYREGYFDSPRRASARDLADALDISTQAFTDRLRRAHAALLEHTLLVDDGG